MSPFFRGFLPALLALLGAVHCADDGAPLAPAQAAGAPAAGAGQAGGGQGPGGGDQAGQGGSGAAGQGAGMGGVGAQAGAGGQSDDPIVVTPAMFVAEDTPLDPIDEGEAIPLSLPPQGGHVLWVGAYITNLRTDTIELKTRLRDPETGALVAEEGRTVVVRPVEGKPGVFQPDIRTVSQVTHVPVCPDYDAKPIAETPYLMEVSVRELYVEPQRTAQGTRTVTPTCKLGDPAGQALCACECEANYTLGKCKDASSP